MEKAERAAKLLAHLEGLAFGAESEAVQVQAATAALNRLEGLPVQKVDATVTRATITAEPMTEDDWTSAYSLAPASGTTESPH